MTPHLFSLEHIKLGSRSLRDEETELTEKKREHDEREQLRVYVCAKVGFVRVRRGGHVGAQRVYQNSQQHLNQNIFA